MTEQSLTQRLDAYLRQVRAGLRGLSAEEADETIEELRSHVHDRAGGALTEDSLAAALAALGDPEELARINSAARVAGRPQAVRTPLSILGRLAELAGLTMRAAVALLISFIGYAFAASWLVVAVAKPFIPDRVGLFRLDDPADPFSYSMGLVDGAPGGEELLGWWIIPIGIVVGLGVAWLTYRYGAASIRRIARAGRPER